MTTEKPVPLSTLQGAFVRYDNSLADVAKDGEYDSLLNPPSIPSILDAYPVGAIYMSVDSTNPGTLFGGTWERIEGKFLLAATDNGDSGASQAPGNTGGEAEHTLTADESGMPAHSHGLNSHTHSVPAHSHGLNSHTHSLNGHTHSLNGHTHSYDHVNGNTDSHTVVFSEMTSHNHVASTIGNGDTQDNTSYLAMYSTNSDLTYSFRGLWGSPNGFKGGWSGGSGAHSHGIGTWSASTGGNSGSTGGNSGNTGAASGNTADSAALTSGAASGNTNETIALNATNAHNNMPPYLSVYVWKRVS